MRSQCASPSCSPAFALQSLSNWMYDDCGVDVDDFITEELLEHYLSAYVARVLLEKGHSLFFEIGKDRRLLHLGGAIRFSHGTRPTPLLTLPAPFVHHEDLSPAASPVVAEP